MVGIDPHYARLIDNPVWPSRGKGRRYVASKLAAIEIDISDGLALGKYRLSKGISVGAQAHCVQKGEGWRVTWDLKEVNKNLQLQDFPALAVKDLMRSERIGLWMVTLALLKAFKQIPIEEGSQKIFNLRSPACDVAPTVMMMGEANAPGKLNQVVQSLFGKVPGLMAYLDDLTISADDPHVLLDRVRQTLEIAAKHRALFNPSKCSVGFQEGEDLGYQIEKGRYRPLEKHLAGVENAPFPMSIKQMQSVLGLGNFGRDFCPRYAWVTAKLHDCTKKGFKYPDMVTEDHRTAFAELKKAMRDSVFLSAMDRTLPVVLRTDASTKACGFELVNIGKDGNDIPILFGSHKFSHRASNWHTIEQEAYAILWSVLCCADLLYGIAFVIETDHRNLQWMNRSTNKKVLNWALHLQNFVFTVRHIPGVTNSEADALSRLPQYDADVKSLSGSAAS
jgi:hypothetical protein